MDGFESNIPTDAAEPSVPFALFRSKCLRAINDKFLLITSSSTIKKMRQNGNTAAKKKRPAVDSQTRPADGEEEEEEEESHNSNLILIPLILLILILALLLLMLLLLLILPLLMPEVSLAVQNGRQQHGWWPIIVFWPSSSLPSLSWRSNNTGNDNYFTNSAIPSVDVMYVSGENEHDLSARSDTTMSRHLIGHQHQERRWPSSSSSSSSDGTKQQPSSPQSLKRIPRSPAPSLAPSANLMVRRRSRTLTSLTEEDATPLLLPLISDLERTHVIGLEGTKTLLPCNVTTPPATSHSRNDSIDLILWFRGRDTRALYSIDARRAPTMQRAKHFSGDELGARAFIDLTTRPTNLVIESVKAEDAGEYRCRVDFRRSPSEHRSILLDVLMPPKEVIIMDEFGQRLSDPITPFNEGSHLNLICEAEGGKPRPMLYWYKDNQLLDDQWTITAQGIVRNELLLPRLTRADQGSLLICQSLLNISDRSISEIFPPTNTGTGSSSVGTASTTAKRDVDQIRRAILSNPLVSAVVTPRGEQLLKLKQSQSSILLELNLRPLTVRITTVRRPLQARQTMTFQCESDGARPPALLSWWKSSHRLEHGITEEVINTSIDDGTGAMQASNRTISTMQFVPTEEDNGQVLSCRADHSVLSDVSLEDSWVLNILFPPKLTVSFGAAIQHDNIHERSNVSLECHILANPDVTDIGWMYEGRRMTFGNRSIGEPSWMEIKGHTLFIYQIDRKNSGRYRCVAANSQGESQSEEILIKVQYKPVCVRNQRTLFGVAQREPLQVPCTVESDPPDVTFRWAFNSSSSGTISLIESFQVRQQTGLLGPNTRTSLARYEPRTRYGYGQLLCWASNKLGEQSEPCRFDVVPAGQPQTLQNCLVRNQSTDGLVVRCTPGDDGGLEQIFHLEVFQADQGQLVANMSAEGEDDLVEFVVKDVPIATNYLLLLYASNAKGRSNYVTLSAATMPPGSRGSEFLRFTSDFGIKPMMYLLVTVVSGLVISAVIIMIVSKIRTVNKTKSRHQPISMAMLSKNKAADRRYSPTPQTAGKDSKDDDDDDDYGRGQDFSPGEQKKLHSKVLELTAGPSRARVIPDCEHQSTSSSQPPMVFDLDHAYQHEESLYRQSFGGTTPAGSSPAASSTQHHPPPMYHTVYAGQDPYMLRPSTESTNPDPDPLLLMDVLSSYYHQHQHPPLNPANFHAQQTNTTGSMTWSQADTIALGSSGLEPVSGIVGGGGGAGSAGGFLTATSPSLSTISVPFTQTPPFSSTLRQSLHTMRTAAGIMTGHASNDHLIIVSAPSTDSREDPENCTPESVMSTAV